jgi:pyroglutamyl-peptidase
MHENRLQHISFVQPMPAQTLSAKTASAQSTQARPRPSSALPRLLVTGFEAFGDDPSGQGLNPSAIAAQALHGKRIAGHRVVAAVLPCVFGQSIEVLKALIKQHQPALIVCVGQAGGRAGISLERIAVNLDDAPLPDNAGCVRSQCPVLSGAPAAYFSTLPVQAMLEALQRANLPCELSSSAGHFVCNHVFYALMHQLAIQPRLRQIRGGFIHVPYLPEQAAASDAPSMPLDKIAKGLAIAVRAALVK